MQKIVGVRRYKDREIYYFLQNIDDLKLKDKVVVNFDDFQTVVEVVKLGLETEDEKAVELTKIIRRANKADLIKYESLIKKAEEYLPVIKKKSLELGLMMKFVSAEYSLDNSKIIIVFSSEDRVDFRQFLKELALLLKIRIELKQIGQRDEVKVCGGVGICGQECCCSRFLKEFEHVTVKMAKNQGLSLSPTKINGICGRLMCCLAYESEMYEKMLAKMPKVGSKIQTPSGEATVVYNDILRERVTVKRQSDNDSVVVEDFTLEELATGKKAEPVKKEGNSQLDEFLKKNADVVSEEKKEDKASTSNETAKTQSSQQKDLKNNANPKQEKQHNKDVKNTANSHESAKNESNPVSQNGNNQDLGNQISNVSGEKPHNNKNFKHGFRDRQKSNNNSKNSNTQNIDSSQNSHGHRFDKNKPHSKNFKNNKTDNQTNPSTK